MAMMETTADGETRGNLKVDEDWQLMGREVESILWRWWHEVIGARLDVGGARLMAKMVGDGGRGKQGELEFLLEEGDDVEKCGDVVACVVVM